MKLFFGIIIEFFVLFVVISVSVESEIDLSNVDDVSNFHNDKMPDKERIDRWPGLMKGKHEASTMEVGNFAELTITNIDIWHDMNIPQNIHNWKSLEHNDEIYLVGTEESSLFLYHFEPDRRNISLIASISDHGKIKIFELFSELSIDESINDSMHIILSVEDNDGINYLKWYSLEKQKLIPFWIWRLEKTVEKIKYFELNGETKLLLLYESEYYFHEMYSPIEIYNLKILGQSSEYKLCYEFLSSEIFDIEVCPSRGASTIISLLGRDHIILYEYREENMDRCVFNQIKDINMHDVESMSCFESGNLHYLSISGSTTELFEIYPEEPIIKRKMESVFREIGVVKNIQILPVDTYKNEVILFIKFRNSTVLAFAWYDSDFKQISLPNRNINQINLPEAKIIPNFGFISGQFFINIKVQPGQLLWPENDDIDTMRKVKIVLEETLNQQESIINKINHTDLTKISESEELNFNEVEIDHLFFNESNDFNITIGSEELNYTEFQSIYEEALNSLHEIEAQVNEIENSMKNIVMKNDPLVTFNEINITGDIEIENILKVENLTVNRLNDVLYDTSTKKCLVNKGDKILGTKSFPFIDFTGKNVKIKKLNGIPIEDIVFDDIDRDYTNIDLSSIRKLEINGSLNVNKINGIDWNNLMSNLVFKNKERVIPGKTNITGNIKVNHFQIDYLNDLKYPYDYVLKSGPENVNMTGIKYFKTLTVSDLIDVKRINGIDADDFIILNADQNLEHEITFENLVIDESLQIDGNITGIPEQDIDPDLTLLNSNVIQSDVMFTNLRVTGKIFVENSINGSKWSDLDDLILKDDESAIITGKKTFLGNVHIRENLEIKTGIINGRSVNDFVTLDTRQILPNLSSISGDIKFDEVSYEELNDLEEKMNFENEDGVSDCWKKPFVFVEAPIVDELSFLFMNENISGADFSEKLSSALKNVHFETLNVKKLIVNKLEPLRINNVDFLDFKNRRITKTGVQNLSGNITIGYLEIEEMNSNFVNNRPVSVLNDMVDKINSVHNEILNGTRTIDLLNVTGSVTSLRINEDNLQEMFALDDVHKLIFRSDLSIENLIVRGLINGMNISRKFSDCVLKTENDVVIKGPKKIKRLDSDEVNAEFINGHSVDDIITGKRNQTLTGPVKIKGSVKVTDRFASIGTINGILFDDLKAKVEKLDDGVYKLTGDFVVDDDASLENLHVHGYVQNGDIDEIFENIVYLDDQDYIITGTKIFNNSVNFLSNITLMKNINNLDLEQFYKEVVLIDRPISINSELVFENDILVEEDLIVSENLKVGSINGVDIEDLMENALYLNRPTYIMEPMSLSKVIFKSNIFVGSWNGVEMAEILTLHDNQFIRNTLKGSNVSVDDLEINGLVNGHDLKEVMKTTFMISSDQNITGNISFLDEIHIRGDLNSRYINDVDFLNVITLNGDDPMIGNFIFDDPITINGNLDVRGSINGINFTQWQMDTIKLKSSEEQIISGDWTIRGNVDLGHKVDWSGHINNLSLQDIAKNMQMQRDELEYSAAQDMKDLRSMCKDLQKLKNETERLLYKFKNFEHLRVLQFDQRIISIHHFEYNYIDYIMVNFETCHMDVFAYTSEGFVLAANVSDFGYINEYISLNRGEDIYFVTAGKPNCNRSSGNLWSFKDYQFKHIFDFGNVIDVTKLGVDVFAIISHYQVQEWSLNKILNNSVDPNYAIPLEDKNFRFFRNENDILIANFDTILDFTSNSTEVEEFENPFRTNDILNFRAGIYRREYLLVNEEYSNYVIIYNNNLSQPEILQTIKKRKPGSFQMLNFDGFIENLLIFSENKREIQIYEYRGIEGFKFHSRIRQKVDKLSNFKLRLHPFFAKKNCLAVIDDQKLSILVAQMYGERLDMSGELMCDAA